MITGCGKKYRMEVFDNRGIINTKIQISLPRRQAGNIQFFNEPNTQAKVISTIFYPE